MINAFMVTNAISLILYSACAIAIEAELENTTLLAWLGTSSTVIAFIISFLRIRFVAVAKSRFLRAAQFLNLIIGCKSQNIIHSNVPAIHCCPNPIDLGYR